MAAFLDIYWFFFTERTLTGLSYSGADGFARTMGMLISILPTFLFAQIFWIFLNDLDRKK
jgi:uncharacterized membrane protein required for colicin V production